MGSCGSTGIARTRPGHRRPSRLEPMRVLFTMQLGALAGCVLGALGCGGEDETRFVPDGSMVAQPGPGPLGDCAPTQSSTLGLNEQTAFGQSGLDMPGSGQWHHRDGHHRDGHHQDGHHRDGHHRDGLAAVGAR
jgi:PAB1-binding protein PBP1